MRYDRVESAKISGENRANNRILGPPNVESYCEISFRTLHDSD
jgi:hypothetical protein